MEPWLSTFHVVTLNLEDGPTPHYSPSLSSPLETTADPTHNPSQHFRLSLVEKGPEFHKILCDALKKAKAAKPSDLDEVVIDFGPLAFVEQGSNVSKTEEVLEGDALVEKRIRSAFALEDDLDIWGGYIFSEMAP
jgi:hypothetical protein